MECDLGCLRLGLDLGAGGSAVICGSLRETQKCGFAFITLSFSSVAEVSGMITTNDENLWQFMRYLSKMIG